MTQFKKISSISIILILISLSLYACQGNTAEQFLTLPSPTSTVTATPTPTITPIPFEDLEFGTEEHPLIITFISDSGVDLNSIDMDTFIQTLSERTGLFFTYVHYATAKDGFEALRNNEVHFVWTHPITYLAARERDLIMPMFVTNHFGLYQYGFQFFANTSSNFFTYFDENAGENTSNDPATTLRQFEGKRPCYVNDQSLSGKIGPQGILAENDIQPLDPVLVQSPSAVIRALYIKGICDFGVTFAYTGDPRTSSQVINDLPDTLQTIKTIWRSEPAIPSLSFAANKNLPSQTIEKTSAALLVMIQSADGKALFTNSLRYDVQNLKIVDDQFYDPVKNLIYNAGVIPYQFLGY